MVLTNQVIGIFIGVAILIALGFFIAKLMKNPKNQGKEMGLVIGELMIAYPMTWFFGFILMITLAEAFLAASLSSPTASPLARIMMHTGMGLLSVFAAMVWIKELHNIGSDLKSREYKDAFISLGLMCITGFLTFFTPILNLVVIANNLQQIDHVSLLMQRISPFTSLRTYYANVYAAGFDVSTYNPMQAMNDVMLATIGGTIVHILLIVWEALKIMRSKRESTRGVLNSDNYRDPQKPQEGADKKPSKDVPAPPADTGDTEKERPFETVAKKALAFLGYTDSELHQKLKTAIKIHLNQTDPAISAAIGVAFGDISINLRSWKSSGSKESEKKAIQDQIVETFRKSPSKGGLAMTVKIKN